MSFFPRQRLHTLTVVFPMAVAYRYVFLLRWSLLRTPVSLVHVSSVPNSVFEISSAIKVYSFPRYALFSLYSCPTVDTAVMCVFFLISLSNTLNLNRSIFLRDRVSGPYKTIGRIRHVIDSSVFSDFSILILE